MAEMGLADLHHRVVETEATVRGYERGLVELAERGVDVLVMDADLGAAGGTGEFRKRFPDRFMEFGLSEQDMLGTAAGLAQAGHVVFVTAHGMLAAANAWDVIRSTICTASLKVVVCGIDAGFSSGGDGCARQSLEDVAVMRALPGMTVIVPVDAVEARKATVAAARIPGPVYVRFATSRTPVVTTDMTPFTVGQGAVYRQGEDATVMACGVMVYEALRAARQLEDGGLSVRVVNCPTIKPLDRAIVNRAAVETGALVTAEEGSTIGGLGGAVAEALAQSPRPSPLRIMGIEDRFGESGDHEQLLSHFGLSAREIVSSVKDVVARKRAIAAGTDAGGTT
ncbi:MAG: transketolase family protein [Candidatus Eisenbacteria bacterium]|nr:transketolase family protein [Candidatus Eisenbacteria bacterium]